MVPQIKIRSQGNNLKRIKLAENSKESPSGTLWVEKKMR